MGKDDYETDFNVDNMANAISKLKCKGCGKTDQFSIGRHMHAGSEDTLYLECKCGMHCHLCLHPYVDMEVRDWWN
jgi:hypothetical protein